MKGTRRRVAGSLPRSCQRGDYSKRLQRVEWPRTSEIGMYHFGENPRGDVNTGPAWGAEEPACAAHPSTGKGHRHPDRDVDIHGYRACRLRTMHRRLGTNGRGSTTRRTVFYRSAPGSGRRKESRRTKRRCRAIHTDPSLAYVLAAVPCRAV